MKMAYLKKLKRSKLNKKIISLLTGIAFLLLSLPAIRQARDASRHQRIRSFLPPDRHFWPGDFVNHRTACVDTAKLTAALQIRPNDGGHFLRGGIVATEAGHGDRQLRQTDARDLHAELRPCRKAGSQQKADQAAIEITGKREK